MVREGVRLSWVLAVRRRLVLGIQLLCIPVLCIPVLCIPVLCVSAGCDKSSDDAGSETTELPRKKTRKPKADAGVADAGVVDTKALIRWIQDSQREGICERKPEAFMRIWAEDAKIIYGRAETPGPYDHMVSQRATLEKSSRVKARGRADATVALRYEDEVAKVVSADRVDIQWIGYSDVEMGGEKSTDKFGEIYRLRRTSDGWRVYENRSWRLTATASGETKRFDDAYWAARDAEVAEVPPSAPAIDRIVFLDRAMRYAEAYALAVTLTAKEPTSAEGWHWRMLEAMRLQDVDDAIRSAKEFRARLPDGPVPGWIEASL